MFSVVLSVAYALRAGM